MTFISQIDLWTAELPFRFAFGHALAQRSSSVNVYAKVTLDDGSVGFGEGVPRDYVTGETVDSALAALAGRFGPAALTLDFRDADDLPRQLQEVAQSTPDRQPDPAAWCALELALLDACGKHFGCSVRHWLCPAKRTDLRYDAVIPFLKPRQLVAVALAIRVLGFKQVKLKVGDDLARDLWALRLLRRILGAAVDLRVDANCAWSADQALEAIGHLRQFGISAVEQPVPADDFEGLRRITTATHESIIVDESLRTMADATALAESHACDIFNLRVSKCGGLLESMRIARVATQAGLGCIVGAQVGESGILSAAGRHLAACLDDVRCLEGSAGRLLLKEDLTVENVLPGWGGRARPFDGPGLGIRVKESTLDRYGRLRRTLEARTSPVGAAG